METQDFYITQILRQINFEKSSSSKTAISGTLTVLKFMKIKVQSLWHKMADIETL